MSNLQKVATKISSPDSNSVGKEGEGGGEGGERRGRGGYLHVHVPSDRKLCTKVQAIKRDSSRRGGIFLLTKFHRVFQACTCVLYMYCNVYVVLYMYCSVYVGAHVQ